MSSNQTNYIATTIQNNNKRVEKWDLLRALLIFLVVLGHLADRYTSSSENMRALYLFIYTFHIPCFLFLDGLLGKRNVKERRYGHIFSYLIIYLFIKVLTSVVDGFINQSVSFSLLSDSAVAWYGLCLFWCSLLTIFLCRFSPKWVLIASIIIACMVGYDSNVGDMFVLSKTIVFYPFYFIGYCLDPEQVAKKLSAPAIRVCSALFLVILGAVCLFGTDPVYFFRALLTGRHSYMAFTSVYGMNNIVVAFGGLLRLLYYVVAVGGCISIISLIPNHLPHSRAIRAVGKRSLEIYILHNPLIHILYDGVSLPSLLAAWGIGGWVILPLAIIITSIFALPFWEKPIRAIIYPTFLEHRDEQAQIEG